MASKHQFKVSYRLADKPYSTQVESDAQSLTSDQALFHVQSLHSDALPTDITDVQVTPSHGEHRPGQQQQP